MAKNFDGAEQLVKNWLQNKNTVDFLGVWEKLNNPNFNLVELHQIKEEAGLNRFVMSVKIWVERTNGIGLIAKAGKYGGTYAHKDIALEFGSWLSPEFKLYLIKEFQRLKDQESRRENLEWNIRRTLAKAQYRVHTDSIKEQMAGCSTSHLDLTTISLRRSLSHLQQYLLGRSAQNHLS